MTKQPKRFFKWCAGSLWGHLVLCWIFGSVPVVGILALSNYSEWVMSLDWILTIVVTAVLFDIAMAVPLWFLVTKPRLKWAKEMGFDTRQRQGDRGSPK